MAQHVMIKFNVHTWLQQPGGTKTIERFKNDEDVVPRGYANELVSCGMAEIIGNESDVPVLVEFREVAEDVSS